MTLNLLITVPDGMVMLADSMLTLATAEITSYQNAEKLIAIGKHPLPAAAMISGTGSVNGKLVSQLLRKAGKQLDLFIVLNLPQHQHVVDIVTSLIDPEYDAMITTIRNEAANRSSQFDELTKINDDRQQQGLPPMTQIEPRHISIPGRADNHADAFIEVKPPVLTIVVATYFDDEPHSTEIWWPGGAKPAAVPLGWWGSGATAVQRLTMGFDFQKLHEKAEAEAKAPPANPPVDDAQRAEQYILGQHQEFQMGIPFDVLPLQDAIDLTEFLGRVGCGFDQFSIGATRVGGPLDVLVLMPGERRWVKQKEIHSSQ